MRHEKNAVLLPIPKQIQWRDACFTGSLGFAGDCSGLRPALESIWPEALREKGDIRLNRDPLLASEAYRLRVEENSIDITASSESGFFYGCMTLRQLWIGGVPVSCCEISDAPALALRGVLLDVSRGKIPLMAELKSQIDLLASLKYNHLELYLEGFSFAYPQHPSVYDGRQPLTAEDFRELNAYCAARFMQFVPCSNTLGHMDAWLARPEFADLAECPGGPDVMGVHRPATTMDTEDPAAFSFVRDQVDVLCECTDGPFFNVCLDEAFELGIGKNKAAADEKGREALFLSYVKKLHAHLKTRHRRMMMWGDMLSGSPELYGELPGDITVLEWGYEKEHPFESRARELHNAGLPFCLCPGTNAWNSFTGMTDNMLDCIFLAARNARKYQALGMIITDWGDSGHMQYAPFSWPGLFFGASCAWGEMPKEELLALGIDLFSGPVPVPGLGHFLLDAGRYYLLEEQLLPCRTMAHYMLNLRRLAPDTLRQQLKTSVMINDMVMKEKNLPYHRSWEEARPFEETKLIQRLDGLLKTAGRLPAADLVRQECENGLAMVHALSRTRGLLYGQDDGAGLTAELGEIISRHENLWRQRNRDDGMEIGVRMLQKVISICSEGEGT